MGKRNLGFDKLKGQLSRVNVCLPVGRVNIAGIVDVEIQY